MNESTKKLLTVLKTLPKYQLERRIDIFILEKLNEVFTKLLGKPAYFIYPEFPLRSLETIDNNLVERKTNHNTNVDYLLATEDEFYLVEFKTDAKSFSDVKQMSYYTYYFKKSFSELFNFFKTQLAEADHQDPKWKVGMDYLKNNYKNHFDKLLIDNLEKEVKLIYLAPSKVKDSTAYRDLVNKVGDKLIFVSLTDFANAIKDDDELKQLLIEIDK
ncbi:MAG: hypothetical protein JWN78_1199 [Bacteroidota bacterium]|nr:hypothetical protein [Bacteroidota bacterium]